MPQGQVGREVGGHVIRVSSGHWRADWTHDLLGCVAMMTGNMVHQTGLGESKSAI